MQTINIMKIYIYNDVFPKLSKYWWLIGGILYAIGILFICFESDTLTAAFETNKISLLYNYSPTLFYSALLVLFPVVSELMLRNYVIKHKKLYHISSFLFNMCTFAITESFLCFLIVTVGEFIFTTFFLKEDNPRRIKITHIVMFVIFSLIWYFGSFISIDTYVIIPAIMFLGLSIILNCIACEYGIIYSIIAHVINNIFIGLLLFININSNSEQHICSDNFDLSISKTSSNTIENIPSDNTIIYSGNLEHIISSIIDSVNKHNPYFSDEKYIYNYENIDTDKEYTFAIYPKENILRYDELLDSIVSATKVIIDTNLIYANVLYFDDDYKFKPSNSNSTITIKELEQYLRRTRDIPLVLDFDINDIFPIHLDTCKIKQEENIDSLLQTIGLKIDYNNNRTIYMINISD